MNINEYASTRDSAAVISERPRSLIFRLLPLWVLIASVGVVFVMVASFKKPPESKEKPDIARLVDTIVAQPQEVFFDVKTYGTVQPSTETSMVAEVAGQVVQVSPAFVAGGFLRAGESLLRIDASDYQTALLSAEASLASNMALLSQEQAQSEQARKDWNRLNPNREPNALVLRLPQLDGAKAAVRSAEAGVLKARRDLERTNIRMPYDGLVKARKVNLGQYVSPGASVGDIFAVDQAEVRLPLNDEDLRYLNLPQVGEVMSNQTQQQQSYRHSPVSLSADVGGENVTWPAQLARTEGIVDSSSRVVYAVAQINDPYGLLGSARPIPLKVGTFVSAHIQGKQANNIVQIPRSVLQPDSTLLIANAENTLEVRQVEVVRTTPEFAYIGNGLIAGERIITTSIATPIPGIAVRTSDDSSSPTKGADGTRLVKLADHTELDTANTVENTSNHAAEQQAQIDNILSKQDIEGVQTTKETADEAVGKGEPDAEYQAQNGNLEVVQ